MSFGDDDLRADEEPETLTPDAALLDELRKEVEEARATLARTPVPRPTDSNRLYYPLLFLTETTERTLRALAGEVARLTRDYQQAADNFDHMVNVWGETTRARDRAEAALRKYGAHDAGCGIRDYRGFGTVPPCTCGLDAALAGEGRADAC